MLPSLLMITESRVKAELTFNIRTVTITGQVGKWASSSDSDGLKTCAARIGTHSAELQIAP